MKSSYLLIAMTASLVACNNGPVDEPVAADDMATPAVTSDTAVPAMPPAPSATVPKGDGAKGDEMAAADDAMIPAALQGRWGINDADCTSTRGDNKGLITVGDDQIRFYESTARLSKISERSDSRIVADFSFSGEGRTWSKGMTLDAQDGGKTLIRRETGVNAMPGPERYKKCG